MKIIHKSDYLGAQQTTSCLDIGRANARERPQLLDCSGKDFISRCDVTHRKHILPDKAALKLTDTISKKKKKAPATNITSEKHNTMRRLLT